MPECAHIYCDQTFPPGDARRRYCSRVLSELLADQGIAGPQGLNALVNDAQVPETDEDAFLAAIFAEDE